MHRLLRRKCAQRKRVAQQLVFAGLIVSLEVRNDHHTDI